MRTSFLKIMLGTAMLTSGLFGQPVRVENPFVLNVDYARFKYDEQSTYLEIYYAFYPSLVTFAQKDGKYQGSVMLSTSLRKQGTGEVVIERTASHPMVIADMTAPFLRTTYVTQAGYTVPFGDYVLEVIATDSVRPHRTDRLSLPISFRPVAEGISISDLELCSNITQSDDKTDAFYKNTLVVLPNPTLVFGVMNHPVIFSYAELYNVDPAAEYTIRTIVRDAANATSKESSKKKKYGVQNAVEVTTVNIASLPSGKYSFIFALGDGSVKEFALSEKIFYVNNPHIAQSTVVAEVIKSSELAGLSADEIAEEFRMAQYLATDQEVKMFSQITSETGRREFLAKFWVDVESGAGGRRSLNRNEYLHRVAVAHQRFRAMNRVGWRTDRGRVFILYAEPDEIERFPSSEKSKPYEIWKYYQIENGVEFVFVDRSGFGDYVQVHSTKRGELRDDTWQRFLY